MKSARIVITFKCLRKCAGCCNTYNSIMSHVQTLSDFNIIKEYDVIMITGGEPMLSARSVIEYVRLIRQYNSHCKIYLYTAYHNKSNEDLKWVLEYVDGIQYSLHAEATPSDIDDFHAFQNCISSYPEKSFRLFIDNKVPHTVNVLPRLWKRVEVKAWMTEEELLNLQPNGLPLGENLFIVNGLTIPKPIL